MTNNQGRSQHKHWSKLPEKGSIIGLKFMLICFKLLGRRVTYVLMFPAIVYFYLFSRGARKASWQYFIHLQRYAAQKNIVIKPQPFRHFMSFGKSLIDKVAVWNKIITRHDLHFPNRELLLDLVNKKQGAIIFSAHLGNIEVMRALSGLIPKLKVNALIFNQHAQKFNTLLTQVNADSQLSLISIEHIDLVFAIQLQQKIDQGEFIIIACDRISVNHPNHTIWVEFLGEKCILPQGPFILSAILQAPVYTMLCLKQKKRFNVVFESFAQSIKLPRHNRQLILNQYAQQYSDFIAWHCIQYPTQWFNFFDFWGRNDQ
ncbi:hypothetical protein [Fastidiosibacter lacustris]|uniref:LpxL/LpxP family acyltransferase n=1 Tax=Fastidiosibacter lacustris TaxID=2056695 RepID=UPI000E341A01|nr:hypothetical protein [Fastidiosibacter lacustris]